MKRVGNLYNQITDIKNIKKMYDKRVRLNTKNKIKIEKFDQYYTSNILHIKEMLEKKTYQPSKYNIFLIKDPKVRLIMSQNITDKIVNHLVSEYFLVNVFDKTLIDENVATRINKGTHFGIKKLTSYLRKHINDDLYILKFDIAKYFFNLDHDILKSLIRRKIKDPDALNILDVIIDSTDKDYINKEINTLKEKEINKLQNRNISNKKQLINDIKQIPLCQKGKSAPIGNMSSQAFAIIYLNELDNFIKKELKVDLYIRYQDDGLLISYNKQYLKECLFKINNIVEKYKLKLNNKTRIYNIDEGFEFLGFKYIRKNNKLIIKLKNQTKRKFKRKMKTLYKLYYDDKINLKDVNQVKASYLGHLKYGNTTNLIKNTLSIYGCERYDNIGEYVFIDEFGSVKKCKTLEKNN